MSSWFQRALSTAHELLHSSRRVPLVVYLYIGVLLYMYRRMSWDFLGMGTRSKKILGKKQVDLTKEEASIAENVVDPANIRDTFDHVGGLDKAKELLKEHVVWPFQHPEYFTSGGLRSHPTGVLLYGPPGTGKTLLARALAKEINGYFLDVRVEKLFTKWVGDSEKLASAVFSLARKLSPCVIFVDEIDALLSTRNESDSAVYTHAKTIFLTNWDGLLQNGQAGTSGEAPKILVVGATNRPNILDDAIVRRMPIRIEVGLPDVPARRDILSILLEKELNDNKDAGKILSAVALRTERFTGSDLRELCRVTAMAPLRRLIRKEVTVLPPLTLSDFDEALRTVRPSSTKF
jgi:ATPase family AAA domain-containing protein 1